MNEIWKPIQGHDGRYEVSNMGRVRSLDMIVSCKNGQTYSKKGRILKSSGGKIYRMVSLGSVNQTVHRLVAMAFVPNPDMLPIVNHINEDKNDNRAVNLEWCTQRYNTNYGTAREKRSKGYLHTVTAVEQRDMNGRLIKRYETMGDAARETGISGGSICKCCKKNKSHFTAGGYKWNYVNPDDLQ